MTNPYNEVKEFHAAFDPTPVDKPKEFNQQQALYRGIFKGEEIVEFLYATANNNPEVFNQLVADFQVSIDQAKSKIVAKNKPVSDPLVEQTDALIDLLYFTYGSFVLMGIDPTPLFSIVHQANMGKLFPDGKPHYDSITGKVLKPDNWEKDFAPEQKLKIEIEKQLKSGLS